MKKDQTTLQDAETCLKDFKTYTSDTSNSVLLPQAAIPASDELITDF